MAPVLHEIELLIVTHIDIDHIDGIVTLLNQDVTPFIIKQIWFNNASLIQKALNDDILGQKQGEYLTHLIKKKNIDQNKSFKKQVVLVDDFNKLPSILMEGGMEIILLAPGTEDLKGLLKAWSGDNTGDRDDSDIANRLELDKRYIVKADDLLGGIADIPDTDQIEEMQNSDIKQDVGNVNRSSIAFLAKFDGKTCLFAGDSPSDCLLKSVSSWLIENNKEKLYLDGWKMAHHGSKKSTHDSLMKKIQVCNVMFSTDGNRYGHPDRECIAKLFKYNKHGIRLHFNYNSDTTRIWDDDKLKEIYNYQAQYPVDKQKPGVTVRV